MEYQIVLWDDEFVTTGKPKTWRELSISDSLPPQLRWDIAMDFFAKAANGSRFTRKVEMPNCLYLVKFVAANGDAITMGSHYTGGINARE